MKVLGIGRSNWAEEDELLSRESYDEAELRAVRRRNRLPVVWRGLPGWLILGGLAAADYLVFRAFDTNYVLVAVPLVCVVNLVAGAPARAALGSPTKIVEQIISTESAETRALTEVRRDEPLPAGAVEIGFATKPVTVTAAISAGLLFVLAKLI